MDEILTQLRAEFPTMSFDGGEDALGYWLQASQGDWVWRRGAVSSLQSMLIFATTALAVAAGQGAISV